MVQLSQNENIMNNNDEIYLNDVVMEEEKIEKSPNFSQVCKEKKILM
jgi:hypothetical protein